MVGGLGWVMKNPLGLLKRLGLCQQTESLKADQPRQGQTVLAGAGEAEVWKVTRPQPAVGPSWVLGRQMRRRGRWADRQASASRGRRCYSQHVTSFPSVCHSPLNSCPGHLGSPAAQLGVFYLSRKPSGPAVDLNPPGSKA